MPNYVFADWDKDFTNVQSDLTVKALYEQTKTIKYLDPATGTVYILKPGGSKYDVLGKRIE